MAKKAGCGTGRSPGRPSKTPIWGSRVGASNMRALLLPSLAILLLAGCIGIPEGTADVGDTVSVRFVAFHLETGEPLVWTLSQLPVITEKDNSTTYPAPALRSVLNQAFNGTVPEAYAELFTADGDPFNNVTVESVHTLIKHRGDEMHFARTLEFQVGAGQSGLGLEVERSVRALQPGTPKTVKSATDPSRTYYDTRETNSSIGPFELTRVISRAEFSRAGKPAEVGTQFAFNGLYDAEVTHVDDGSVTYRVLAENGRLDPIPQLGILLETQTSGDQWTWRLRPDVGQTFVIQPPSSLQQETPLGLDPGSYKTLGTHGDHVLYGYNPTLLPTLLDLPVLVMIEVTSVTEGSSTIPTEDFGTRQSPVVRSVGHSHAQADAPKTGHDDGHGHTH